MYYISPCLSSGCLSKRLNEAVEIPYKHLRAAPALELPKHPPIKESRMATRATLWEKGYGTLALHRAQVRRNNDGRRLQVRTKYIQQATRHSLLLLTKGSVSHATLRALEW